MKKIIFVCLGNICRSPMAEFVMKDLVKKAGREKEFEIISRATSDEEEGNPVHRGTRRKLDEMGVPYQNRYATVITRAECEDYDYIIGMDDNNIRALKRLTGGGMENKIRRLLADKSVADPWWTGNFDETYDDVLRGCKKLLEEM